MDHRLRTEFKKNQSPVQLFDGDLQDQCQEDNKREDRANFSMEKRRVNKWWNQNPPTPANDSETMDSRHEPAFQAYW